MSQARSEFEQLNDEKSASLITELTEFIIANKAWWMVPIVLVLAVFGVAIALAATGFAPFLYTFW